MTQKSNLGTHSDYRDSLITPMNTRTLSTGPASMGGGARVAYRKGGEPCSSNLNADDILVEHEEISGAESI